jgi:hypothetical protein
MAYGLKLDGFLILKHILKNTILLFLLVFTINTVSAQLHHQMLSSQGSTSKTASGVIATQTIGQTSVIGTYDNLSFKIGQGYQQAFWGRIITNQNSPDFEVSVFPNPFENDFNISYNGEGLMSIYIYDVAGKLIYNKDHLFTTPQKTISVDAISSGVYLVRLQTKKLNYFTKLIKL